MGYTWSMIDFWIWTARKDLSQARSQCTGHRRTDAQHTAFYHLSLPATGPRAHLETVYMTKL